jgi:hypothetical protein
MTARLLTVCGALLAAASARAAEGNEEITAVSSKVSGDYARAKLADGSLRPETYAFAEGGHWGGTVVDETIDKLRFIDVARMIASPLSRQGYLPSKDPERTKLLIMVYWGTTVGTSDTHSSLAYQQAQEAGAAYMAQGSSGKDASGNSSAMVKGIGAIIAYEKLSQALAEASLDNRQRDETDRKNAEMLGYNDEGLIGTEFATGLDGNPLRFHRDDLVAEIEQNRYFVVLMAFDFQMLWKQKKHKVLWETRFSLRQMHHDFGKDLPAMAQYASQYFGQDSHGLVRNPIPLGHVKVGEPTSLGIEAAK